MIRNLVLTLTFLSSSFAQAGDWPTFGHDPRRTGWAREETVLNKENATRLGLLWKVPLKNTPLSLTALTAPIALASVPTKDGPKDIVYVGGSGDVFYAIDASNGAILWEKTFKTETVPRTPGMWLCPKGLNATPVADRATGAVYAIASDGRLYAMDLATGQEKFRAISMVAPYSKNWSLNMRGTTIYTSISQNCGDTPSGVTSIDIADPVNPVIRHWRSAKYGAGIWGRGGILLGNDGTIYGATGDGDYDPQARNFGQTIFALDPDTLKLEHYFTPKNWDYVRKRDFDMTSSPVAFLYRGRELVAVGGKEGLIYLMDGAKLGGEDNQTPLYTTPLLCNEEEWFEGRGVWGNLSFYRDEQNRHWVYAPIWGPVASKAPEFPTTNGPNPNGSIMAFLVTEDEKTDKPYLKPMWVSADFSVPEPVGIANGVVFAISNGENVRQTVQAGIFQRGNLTLLKDDERRDTKTKAELRALDAETGKLLYSSGPDVFDTWTHFGGLAISNGRVFAVDFSSTLYCFGVK